MRNFLGQDGFIWWIGIVEDVADPLKLGRCRVRIFGYHPPKKDKSVKIEDLPWAMTIHPTNTPNLYATPNVGDWVFGFFLDATTAQEPAVLGYIPGIPLESQEFFGEEPMRDSANKLIRTFKSLVSYTESDPGFDLKNTILWESRNKDPDGHGHFILFYDDPTYPSLYLKSNGGHYLKMDHYPSDNKMVLSSNSGNKIAFSDTTNTISIQHTSGSNLLFESTSVTINHFSGAKIEIDENGKISIHTTDTVSLEADTAIITSNDLTVNAQTMSFNASESLTLKDQDYTWTPTTINDTFNAVNNNISSINTDINTIENRLDTPTYGDANGVTVIVGI